MRFTLYLTIALILCSNIVLTQLNYIYYPNVLALNNGDTLTLPWAGGLNTPEFSEIDFDGDGKKDLFVFDKSQETVKTFINEGSVGQVAYVYDPTYEKYFLDLRIENFGLLRDFDCDGYEDLFAGISGNIRVYKNMFTEENEHIFDVYLPLLKSQYPSIYTNLYNNNTDVPGIVDFDGDGDLDILSFDSNKNQPTLHNNLSVENYGMCDTLVFEAKTRCWGHFLEDANNNDIYLDQDCGELKVSELDESEDDSGLHEGSTMTPVDLDFDGDKDLLLGDISFQNLVALYSDETQGEAIITSYDLDYPSYNTSVQQLFPVAFYLDVDNDNVKDIITASNSSSNYHNTNSAWFYKNNGITDSVVLNLQTTAFLQEEMIDVGERAVPAFFDYNVDGLMDLVIGTDGYDNGNSVVSKLLLLENIGTAQQPAFEIVNTNFANVASQSFTGVYPTFGDLDNDNDDDMIIGTSNGRIHFFENIAASGEEAVFDTPVFEYMSIDVGDGAVPQLFDVNDDDVLDLLIGDRNGNINYYQNTGTSSSAMFDNTPTDETFGNVDTKPGTCCSGNSTPYMVNSENGKILYVGSDQGFIWSYGNIEDNLGSDGVFTVTDSIQLRGKNAVIVGSLFNEGNDALIIGDGLGGVTIFQKDDLTNNGTSIFENPLDLKIYPNPFNYTINIAGQLEYKALLQVTDVYGKRLQEQDLMPGIVNLELNTSSLASGIYYIEIKASNNKRIFDKMIKLK